MALEKRRAAAALTADRPGIEATITGIDDTETEAAAQAFRAKLKGEIDAWRRRRAADQTAFGRAARR